MNLDERDESTIDSQQTQTTSKVDFNKAAKEGVEVLNDMKSLSFRMFKKPMSTFFEEISKVNLKLSVGILLIYGIVFGIISMILMKKMDGFGSIFGQSIFGFGDYFKMFVTALMGIAIYAALLIGIIIGTAKLLKKEASIGNVVTMVGIAHMPACLTLIGAVLISLVSLKLASFLLIVGIIMTFLMLIFGLKNALTLEDDQLVYIVPGILVVLSIAMGLINRTGIASPMSSFSRFF